MPTAAAEAPAVYGPAEPEKPADVEGLIRYHAARAGVDPDAMVAVAWCESRHYRYALGDGGKSRGIFQIHSRWHPEVSDAVAFDPDLAAEWAARRFAAGYGYEWTCARNLGVLLS